VKHLPGPILLIRVALLRSGEHGFEAVAAPAAGAELGDAGRPLAAAESANKAETTNSVLILILRSGGMTMVI
jgi:hypothetical protein